MAKADLGRQEQAARDLTRDQVLLLILAGTALLLVVTTVAALIARSIARPIQTITAKVTRPAEANGAIPPSADWYSTGSSQ